ncbi:uncharacterized protein KY384_000363 [Bacidia gigantensis]|uniref:uncharacterized protein n=1 Tax=Bacidia gigantensis TaxID=2732470 RepID=UPI001D0530D4|nr:uncharacterized protein KY384_000363 [Bacidia gigantensis]KAG8526370.1 hypothetical protein KY384_000363 [Bacidia gigantensis]
MLLSNPELAPLILAAILALIKLCQYILSSILGTSFKTLRPKRLWQLDPFLGLDTVVSSYHRLRLHRFLSTCQERFTQAGNTYVARIPGSEIIVTCEPENLKALLATQHQDFELGERRRHAFRPLLGDSIFASDGHIWKEARQQLRPSFAKDRLSRAETIDIHVNALVETVHAQQKRDGIVDLQELFFRFSLDVATSFLFGDSCHSLSAAKANDSAATEFADAFNRSQQRLVDRFVVGSVADFVPNSQFKKDCLTVRTFAEKYVNIAINRSRGEESGDISKQPPSILADMAGQCGDIGQLRDQALSLLVAGRDTTASLLSNLFFVLSRSPNIWHRLKAEVETLEGRRPDPAEFKDLKYLQGCIREYLADRYAENLALAEVECTVVKFLQHFDRMSAVGPSDWKEQLTLTCCVKDGVKVTLRPREDIQGDLQNYEQELLEVPAFREG